MKLREYISLLAEVFPNTKGLVNENIPTEQLFNIFKDYSVILFVRGDITSEFAKETRKQLKHYYVYGHFCFDD
jgi:hypothetical protein